MHCLLLADAAYIAFYTLLPQAAGGRLYSDTMAVSLSSCFLFSRYRLACTISLPTPSTVWDSVPAVILTFFVVLPRC